MDTKEKIGLITFHGHNYGSNLQCYSTKSFVESLGFQCDLLKLKRSKLSFFERVKRIPHHILKIVKNPLFLKIRYKEKKYKSHLSDVSAKLMDDFVMQFLNPIKLEYKELCSTSKYAYFITGSDQVWNVFCDVSPLAFLQFTSRNKRIALATSFGISEIPRCNQKKLRQALDGFDYISVREETGAQIVKEYSNAKVCRISDPTFIYNSEEWSSHIKNVEPIQKKFILVHFLDEPNQAAIKSIKWLQEQSNLDVIAIGYNYQALSCLKRFDFMNGGPWEYVSLIKQADYILTDSFHSVLFSINFNKRFFIFHRQYTESRQTSRITDLLKRFDLENRLIESDDVIKKNYLENLPEYTQTVLEKERDVIRDYIQKSISGKIPECFLQK